MNAAVASARVPETSDYINSWASSLSEVLAEKLGSPVLCNALPSSSNLTPISEDDTWFTVTVSGRVKGELAFRIPTAFRQNLSSHSSGGAGSQPGDVDGLMLEILELSATRVQACLEPGCEVKHRVEKTQPPSWNSQSTHTLQAQFANPVLFELCLEKTLLESLQSIRSLPPTPQVPASITGTEKLGMLMEVELAVTMRFGGKRMLLKDILDLCTGSVVELDQQVQEPVDLLLDGRPVARGEVVVVEGNYGLRITEVISGNEK